MKPLQIKQLIIMGGFLILCVQCGSPRRSEPINGTFQFNEKQLSGQRIFMQNCNVCHPRGEAGFGLSLNDKPLPRSVIKLQVRKGAGAMPSFSEEEISNTELDDLIEYIIALRKQK